MTQYIVQYRNSLEFTTLGYINSGRISIINRMSPPQWLPRLNGCQHDVGSSQLQLCHGTSAVPGARTCMSPRTGMVSTLASKGLLYPYFRSYVIWMLGATKMHVTQRPFGQCCSGFGSRQAQFEAGILSKYRLNLSARSGDMHTI